MLLEEMVKIQAAAYDEEAGEALSAVQINSGDFILDFKDKDNFSMRLITVRAVARIDTPTFICGLTQFCIGLKKDPRLPVVATHLGFVFNETTIYRGLVKAFLYKGLSLEEANRKAAAWMAQYYQAGERGELDSFLRFNQQLREKLGFEHFPRHFHKRSSS